MEPLEFLIWVAVGFISMAIALFCLLLLAAMGIAFLRLFKGETKRGGEDA